MKVTGIYQYEKGLEFDYIAYVDKGDKGDYWTPPSPDCIEIDFIGFLPDTNLGECLRDEIFEAIREQIQEEL
jgi:hypothetical protein